MALASAALPLAISCWAVWVWTSLPDVAYLRTKNPDETALMRQRAAEAAAEGESARRLQHWMPLDAISERLKQAVIMAEDAGFYTHSGFDLHEIREALRRNWKEGRTVRGASTLTQQLAKNLFLSTDRTYARKLEEALLTYRLERDLSKNRLLELYLNVIEWGDGVYGAEAAARRVFGKSAGALDVVEAATLAAMIPNPRRLDPCQRPDRVKTRQERVLRWMHMAEHLDEEELERALAEDVHYPNCPSTRPKAAPPGGGAP